MFHLQDTAMAGITPLREEKYFPILLLIRNCMETTTQGKLPRPL